MAAAIHLAALAAPGETALGESSRLLAGDAVRVERLGTDGLEGTAAWRLTELVPDAPAVTRRFDTPLSGREHELAQLREAFARAGRTARRRQPSTRRLRLRRLRMTSSR